MGSRMFPAALLFCPALLNTAKRRDHVTIFAVCSVPPPDSAARRQGRSGSGGGMSEDNDVALASAYGDVRQAGRDRVKAELRKNAAVAGGRWNRRRMFHPDRLATAHCGSKMILQQICSVMVHLHLNRSQCSLRPAVPKTAGQRDGRVSYRAPCATGGLRRSCR